MKTVGIDEVGRGCWAGPLVAGAAILLHPIEGLADSKVLSKKRRNEISIEIQEKAVVGLGWVWPEELDERGITWAVKTAMERALAQITTTYDEIIIDGNINFLAEDSRSRAVIKADGSIPAVSAASIAAKVARDTYMEDIMHTKYPYYGFDKHVGYGTAMHIAALFEHGVCDAHRTSYKPIKKILQST